MITLHEKYLRVKRKRRGECKYRNNNNVEKQRPGKSGRRVVVLGDARNVSMSRVPALSVSISTFPAVKRGWNDSMIYNYYRACKRNFIFMDGFSKHPPIFFNY